MITSNPPCLILKKGDWIKKIIIQNIMQELDEERRFILKPKSIIDTSNRNLRNRTITKFSIRWKNLSTKMLHGNMRYSRESMHNYTVLKGHACLKHEGM